MKSSTFTRKTKTKYAPLPTQILRSGWWYEQLKREGNLGIYEQYDPNNREKVTGYVVAKIRTQGEKLLPSGTILPPQEVFPPPSKFGTDGFFYMPKSAKSSGLEKAEEKFGDLLAEKGRCSFIPHPIRRANRKHRGGSPKRVGRSRIGHGLINCKRELH